MASAKAKIRHVFGDTFSCRAAPPDILVELSGPDVYVNGRNANITCSTVNRNGMVRLAGKLQTDRKYMSGTTFYFDT